MQYKQRRNPKNFKGLSIAFLLLTFLSPVLVFSQTTYLPQGARENVFLERLEIKAGTDSILNFSKTKPFSRKQVVPVIEKAFLTGFISPSGDSANATSKPLHRLSKVDLYNAQMALLSNSEWTSFTQSSKKTFLKSFYKTPANFYEVNVKDFNLIINPVFQYIVGKEKNNSEHLFFK